MWGPLHSRAVPRNKVLDAPPADDFIVGQVAAWPVPLLLLLLLLLRVNLQEKKHYHRPGGFFEKSTRPETDYFFKMA